MSGSLHRPARDIIISVPAGNPDALSVKTGLDNLPILDKVASFRPLARARRAAFDGSGPIRDYSREAARDLSFGLRRSFERIVHIA